MPGPSNGKKKQKRKLGKSKGGATRAVPPGVVVDESGAEKASIDSSVARDVEEALFQRPFIYDPGNGPRVRDAKMFLNSSFAQPVSVEDELCKEFAQKEVLEMLMAVLPEETALVSTGTELEHGLTLGYADRVVQQKPFGQPGVSSVPTAVQNKRGAPGYGRQLEASLGPAAAGAGDEWTM